MKKAIRLYDLPIHVLRRGLDVVSRLGNPGKITDFQYDCGFFFITMIWSGTPYTSSTIKATQSTDVVVTDLPDEFYELYLTPSLQKTYALTPQQLDYLEHGQCTCPHCEEGLLFNKILDVQTVRLLSTGQILVMKDYEYTQCCKCRQEIITPPQALRNDVKYINARNEAAAKLESPAPHEKVISPKLIEFETLLRANIAAQEISHESDNETMDKLDAFWKTLSAEEREAADQISQAVAIELKLQDNTATLPKPNPEGVV